MPPFHFWLAHPITGLLVGQLRMTDIYSNLRPYWTALAEVIKIQVYAGIKSEFFTDLLRHVLHQHSFFILCQFHTISLFKKDSIRFINVGLDFQRSTMEIGTRFLLKTPTSEKKTTNPEFLPWQGSHS